MHLEIPPLFDALKAHRRVLLAGCGGGFDVYGAVPLAIALRRRGHEVHLANLTFSQPRVAGAQRLHDACWRIDHDTQSDARYFPELHLARWLRGRGEASAVYCLERTGVLTLREAYMNLITATQVDALVLVDGGTDALMKGDEQGLGTPAEDALSICAVAGLELPAFVTCLGFGVDAFHGVCHSHFLENSAELARAGAFLGVASLLPQMKEAQAYLELVAYSNTHNSASPSIVQNSVADAVRGEFGDRHATTKTRGSELYINPLMATYWSYELAAVAQRLTYRGPMEATVEFGDVVRLLSAVESNGDKRPSRPLPM